MKKRHDQLWRCCKCNEIIKETEGTEIKEGKGKMTVFLMACSSCSEK